MNRRNIQFVDLRKTRGAGSAFFTGHCVLCDALFVCIVKSIAALPVSNYYCARKLAKLALRKAAVVVPKVV